MINILLATYNGEKYISEQLDSLFAQTIQDFKILIRDDGSTEQTVEIIQKYKDIYPNRIELIEDNLGNLGSSQSFMKLLEYSDAEYIMFCDQDDVWLPNKIELSLDKMKELEQNNGYDIPLLVFTDLKVVDEKLITIQESFWKYQKLIPNISTHWKKLVAQNVITGCTIIMNQNAKEVSLQFVLDIMIHDQWIGVNVAKYGKIDFLYNQTILYRQHGKNVAGAHSYGIKYISHKLNNFGNILKYFFSVSKHFKDISVFELIMNKFLINVNRFMRN